MSTKTGRFTDGPLDFYQTICMRKPSPVKPCNRTAQNIPMRHLPGVYFTTSMSCYFGMTIIRFLRSETTLQ